MTDFSNQNWIREKEPISHGYSPADAPFYWYLKNASFLQTLAFCPSRTVELERNESWTDNQRLESLSKQILSLGTDEVALTAGMPTTGCSIGKLELTPNKWSIDVDAKEAGVLVVTDKNYPGWKARIDGSETPIISANEIFKAVRIPAGRSRVEFEFQPRSFFVGCFVALSTLALLVLAGLFEVMGRVRKPTP